MRILYIAYSYLPYAFSESLCNGKLVYALINKGWHVDVISRSYEGVSYSNEWSEEWLPLKPTLEEIKYDNENKIYRVIDTLLSGIKMNGYIHGGIRWARRTYDLALEKHSQNHYDVIMTRSPSDIPHIVGYKFSKKTGVKWIANWNDPSSTIWPEPYKHNYSKLKSFYLEYFTKKFLNQADINTFPSHSLKNHFESSFPFLSNDTSTVIPHIALPSSIHKTIEYTKKETFTMCHSGNLSKERNPENLFIALRKIVDCKNVNIRLDIMGHVNQYSESLVEKYRLKDYVRFIGNFSYLEAVNKLQGYDVVVLLEAILDKGIFFPSKLTDYAQSGRPILAISPHEGFAKDLLNKYGGGICVNNQDTEEIYYGLLELYIKWDLNKLTLEYNPSKIYDYCSDAAIIEKYDELLNQLDR